MYLVKKLKILCGIVKLIMKSVFNALEQTRDFILSYTYGKPKLKYIEGKDTSTIPYHLQLLYNFKPIGRY